MNSNEKIKFGAKSIASELEVPHHFLAKLLLKLASCGIIVSVKGPKGGFFMTPKHMDNSLWDIILTVENTERFNECFMGLVKCNNDHPCPVHHIVSPFKEELLHTFKRKTISTIVKEVLKNGTVITLKDLSL